MAAIWAPSFHLPIQSAAMVMPSSLAKPRRPVMAISRARMMKAIQAGVLSSSINEISAAEISSLSAKGSSSLPRTVTWRYFRAK